MPEEQHRSAQEIQADYTNACARIGDYHAKIKGYEVEVAKLHAQICALNIEMLASNAYFAKVAADLEAKKNEKPQG